MENFRKLSKNGWTGENTAGNINIGSLQRIADATEKMAADYTALQNDRDMYKRRNDDYEKKNAALHRKISALRGVITKLKQNKVK